MSTTRFHTALTASLAGAALLAAGCGSSSHLTVSASPRPGIGATYEFAACMRSHGVSNFPDPTVSSSDGSTTIRLSLTSGIVSSPAFVSARKACRHILPGLSNQSPAQLASQQRQHEQDLLAFARCVRAHGFPNFPDPNAQGQLTTEMITAAGIDLHQPAVMSAADACIGASHGLITPADVQQAVNGQQ